MTAFNTVRFKVRPGQDEAFIEAHRKVERNWPGLRRASLIKTGEGTYCIVGEWDDMDSLAAARPHMVATLDTFRHLLEDLGGDLGVTDPVSGPVVLELK
jgi:quinol monooxygenase YgiN